MFPLLAAWTTPEFDPTWWETVLSLIAAAVGGLVVGFEREARRKPAGIKTHALVSLGAAALALMTLALLPAAEKFNLGGADPIRLISGIAGGVGFLGAGAIIQSRGSVKGLTTAATIWVAASLGVACGIGFYLLVVTLTAIVLVILTIVRMLEHQYVREEQDDDYPTKR
jgi:putative Mg2+ transporter-C (MgtC) family protein